MTPGEIRAGLNDPDPEVRRIAVSDVVELATVEARQCVVVALGDPDWRVRKEAIRVASNALHRQALIDDLVLLLGQGENVGARNSALEVLAGFKDRAAPALLAAIETVSYQARKFVVEALGNAPGPGVVDALTREADSKDPNVAAAAIDALARHGGERAIAILKKRLHATDPYQRMAVLDALDRLGAQLAWPELEPLLGDPLVRRIAVRLLGRSRSLEAIDPLVEALLSRSVHAVESASGAIRQLYDELEPARGRIAAHAERFRDAERAMLRGVLESHGREAQRGAALLLLLARDEPSLEGIVKLGAEGVLAHHSLDAFQMWGESAVAPLLAASTRANGPSRGYALELAAELAAASENDGLIAKVRRALRDASETTDPAIAEALARAFLGHAEAEDAGRLLRLAQRFGDAVARQAAEAIEALGERAPDAVKVVLQEVDLDGEHGAPFVRVLARLEGAGGIERLRRATSADRPGTRRAAVVALAEIGGIEAVEQIVLALADEDADVQVAAARALGQMTHGEGGRLATESLLMVLGAGSPAVQAAAARAIGPTLTRSSIPPPGFGASSPELVAGGRAVTVLRELLRNGPAEVALAALETLGNLGDPALDDLLVESLGHPDEEVVKQGLSALSLGGAPRSADRIVLGLSHSAWDVRRIAATLLGYSGATHTAEALYSRRALEDNDLVKNAIDEALAALSAPEDGKRAGDA
jgi:HEAT repeat protein